MSDTVTETGSDVLAALQALVGKTTIPATRADEPVNSAMIRHWVEAMGDENPVYLDDDAARATGRDAAIAPPTMIQAWNMRGYARHVAGAQSSPVQRELLDTLRDAGFTSVVATDSEQEYFAELTPGDVVTVDEVIEAVSPEKTTGLGVGHFITTLKTYRNDDGEVVATQRWRTLRYRPHPKKGDDAPKGIRPRPALNRDNAFWFDAAKEHRLVIQRCTACGTLRHPTGPMCGTCQSLEWDTVEASGRGEVYSFVVNHHPRIPGFEYPLIVAVIALEEGTRLIANMKDVAPEDVTIGMPVVLDWIDPDPDLSLPAFRPADPAPSGTN